MALPLFVFLYLAHVVQGASTLATSFENCPPLGPDGAIRSVWGILGSCALTLLICIWHTIHFDLPRSTIPWFEKPVAVVLLSIFAPEVMVAYAAAEWRNADEQVKAFREKGYEWSMTHSFFAEMGGFVYQGSPIGSLRYLELCKDKKVVNPVITVDEIKDKSKLDVIGKAILAVQLIWFLLQVVGRGARGLAVTLVELDTICMGVLSLLILFLWWHKPLRPRRPHVLYSTGEAKQGPPDISTLSENWKSRPGCLDTFKTLACIREPRSTTGDEEKVTERTSTRVTYSRGRKLLDEGFSVSFPSLCIAWLILGALHLIAWDFEFPTEAEKIAWRVASLVLAGGPLAFLSLGIMAGVFVRKDWVPAEIMTAVIWVLVLIIGFVSRGVLVGLMLASLRALPCSANQTVTWTVYIPHLQV